MRNRNFYLAAAGLGLSAASTLAGAVVTPIDVTAVTDNIAAAATPIGLIGAATLVVMVGIKVYKWVRRAM